MRPFQDEDKSAPRANMTPMIDVTFQLLIFFMCTLRFKTLEGKLSAYMPKDAGPGVGTPAERIRVRLDVLEEGTRIARDGTPWRGAGPFAFEDDRDLRYTIGPRAYETLSEARARLKELHGLDGERGVTIDARAGTAYLDVVPVVDACALLGFEDISFTGAR